MRTNLLFAPPVGGLRNNELVGKRVVDFLLAIIEPSYLLRLRRYKQLLVKVGAFQKNVGHFERKF